MNPLLAFVIVVLWLAPQHSTMPEGMPHQEHSAAMERDAALKRRGADAMGFDQDATIHRFRLTASGGTIEVTVRDRLTSKVDPRRDAERPGLVCQITDTGPGSPLAVERKKRPLIGDVVDVEGNIPVIAANADPQVQKVIGR
jgi:hypothetical protein